MTDTTDIAALRGQPDHGPYALVMAQNEALTKGIVVLQSQLEAERQRADKAQADMQFECDAHIETAESWREWKLRAITAEAEIAALKAKLANPVVLPDRFCSIFMRYGKAPDGAVMTEHWDGNWLDRSRVIENIRAAGFTVKGG